MSGLPCRRTALYKMTLEETKKYAEELAASVSPTRRVFALVGDLGAGKTTFSRFFLHAIGVMESVTSPTFVIMKHYSLPTSYYPLSSAYHMDCYRLKAITELAPLGVAEILTDEKNIVLIEWADRIREALPPDAIWIDFAHMGEGDRGITVRTKDI